MPGEYLPPVVVHIIATNRDLLAKLAESKAALLRFAHETAETHLGANATEFQDKIARAKVELLAFAQDVKKARLGADATEFWTQIAALRAEFAAMSPLDIKVDANVAAAMAKIEALRGGLALAGVDRLLGTAMPAPGEGGGGGRAGIMSFLGGLFARGGGRGGGASIWRRILLGGGGAGSAGIFGIGAGLPAFGSLGSFLGLGPEHLITTGLGIGASAGGAMLGAGLLGLGAAGVSAVGMGTDMAGIGQAAGDIRNTVTAMNNLNKAIAVYGPKSRQAAVATAQLKYTLSGFSQVARSAVVQAAKTASAFKAMFDKVTGQAEKTGAQIITQAMQVGMKFLPTIGKFAAQNLSIIKSSLQPLFSWLQNSGKNGGLGIFKNLERIFQGNLPTGMHALVQGFELLAKTINVVAPDVGHFVAAINRLFTRMNSAKGFAKWAGDVKMLIGTFRTWAGFIKALGKGILDLFKPAVGAGTQVIKSLTAALKQVDSWLSSSGMKSALHNLFGGHLSLIKQLGRALVAVLPVVEPVVEGITRLLGVGARLGGILAGDLVPAFHALAPVGKVLGRVLGSVATTLGTALAPVARAIGPVLSAIARVLSSALVPIFKTWGRVIKIVLPILAKIATTLLGVLAPAIRRLAPAFHTLAKAMGKILVAAAKAAAPILKELSKLLPKLAGIVVGIVVPAVKLFAGVIKLLTPVITFLIKILGTILTAALKALVVVVKYVENHWKAAWDHIKSVAKAVWHWLTSTVKTVARTLKGAWHTVKSDVTRIWGDIVSFFRGIPGKVKSALSTLASDVKNIAKTAWNDFLNTMKSVALKVFSFVKGIPGKIVAAFGNPLKILYNVGKDIVQGLINGVTSMVGAFVKSIGHMASKGYHAVAHFFRHGSPSKLMMELGRDVSLGLAIGISQGTPQAIQAAITQARAIHMQMMRSALHARRLGQLTATSFAQGLQGGALVHGTLNLGGVDAYRSRSASMVQSMERIEKILVTIQHQSEAAEQVRLRGTERMVKVLDRLLAAAKQGATLDEEDLQLAREEVELLRHLQGQVVGPSGVWAAIRANNSQMVTALRAGAR